VIELAYVEAETADMSSKVVVVWASAGALAKMLSGVSLGSLGSIGFWLLVSVYPAFSSSEFHRNPRLRLVSVTTRSAGWERVDFRNAALVSRVPA
jgi:hypothetical protein